MDPQHENKLFFVSVITQAKTVDNIPHTKLNSQPQNQTQVLRCLFFRHGNKTEAEKSIRPIVTFVNSPTYNLSKFLSRVLSSLLKIITVFATLENLLNVLGNILLKKMNV